MRSFFLVQKKVTHCSKLHVLRNKLFKLLLLIVITDPYDGLNYDVLNTYEYCRVGSKIVRCETEDFDSPDESYPYDTPYTEPEDSHDYNTPSQKNTWHPQDFYMFPYRWE